MTTSAMLLGLAWKSLVIAGLTLVVLRLARSRSAGERSMVAHAGLAALLALPAAILFLPKWAPLPQHWFAGRLTNRWMDVVEARRAVKPVRRSATVKRRAAA